MKVHRFDAKQHIRSEFKCKEESLTKYLTEQVNQDIKKNLAACFVIVDDTNHVDGYYTLSNDSISRLEVPQKYQKKVPVTYDVPVTLLGRLAVCTSCEGNGFGEFLLMNALERCYLVSKQIGSMAVVVDPLNENAIGFYLKYGFILLPDSGKMFLPMKTIAHLFS